MTPLQDAKDCSYVPCVLREQDCHTRCWLQWTGPKDRSRDSVRPPVQLIIGESLASIADRQSIGVSSYLFLEALEDGLVDLVFGKAFEGVGSSVQ